jgi:hypothetical protein
MRHVLSVFSTRHFHHNEKIPVFVIVRSLLQIELKENPVFLFSYHGSGSATALHPLLTLKIEGSCTARSVDGQPRPVYSEKLKMQHAPEHFRKTRFRRRNRVGKSGKIEFINPSTGKW